MNAVPQRTIEIPPPTRNEIRMILDLAYGACKTDVGQAVIRNTILYYEGSWVEIDKTKQQEKLLEEARLKAENAQKKTPPSNKEIVEKVLGVDANPNQDNE